jgi:hypothetical protein
MGVRDPLGLVPEASAENSACVVRLVFVSVEEIKSFNHRGHRGSQGEHRTDKRRHLGHFQQ